MPKAAIVEAVGGFVPSHVTRLAKLKKAYIANEAGRLADGTGWMPVIFRTEGPQQGVRAVAEDANAQALEEAAAVADEQPQAEARTAGPCTDKHPGSEWAASLPNQRPWQEPAHR